MQSFLMHLRCADFNTSLSLTGADTVIFYDSDFNPQMDKQCEDRFVVSDIKVIRY